MRSAIAVCLVAAMLAGCSNGHTAGVPATTPTVGTAVAASTTSTSGNKGTVGNPTTAADGTAGTVNTSATGGSSTATAGATGAGDGIGDRLYPTLGNPGIDVTHYGVDITYDPSTRDLQGVVDLSITATQPLATFTLDEVGLKVAAVTIGGSSVNFTTADPELHITPAARISTGTAFDVQVTYSTRPATGRSPATDAGWFPTSGGAYTVDEPDGTRMWMPSDDHPLDKATYDVTLRVPAGLTAVANGSLTSHTTVSAGEVWVWKQDQPMASYLTQIVIGKYSLVTGVGPHKLPLLSAVLTSDKQLMKPYIDETPKQIAFFEQYFGPYPFDNYGIAMTDSESGLAMEEQGRSLFSRDDFSSGQLGDEQELLLSHELAHQWYGDAVSPAQWQDIWLNESFATYGEWMWLDHLARSTVREQADRALTQRSTTNGPATGTPSVGDLFGFNEYEGGAVVLEALRLTVGDKPFFAILRSWVQNNLFQARTSADFIALAEKVSGKDLHQFFADWLYAKKVPEHFPS